MHTPEQAAELWCPMVRAANGLHSTNVAANTEKLADNGVNRNWSTCIAGRCAMWRWSTKVDPDYRRPKTIAGQIERAPLVPPTHGYCGLAGRPAAGQ